SHLLADGLPARGRRVRPEACGLGGGGGDCRGGPLDSYGRDRGSRARRCAVGRALYPLPLAPRPHLCRKNSFRHAQGFWRTCRTQRPQGEAVMTPKTGATTARPADPCCLVIFGASGDLTHRLLVPALYNLAAAGLLPQAFGLIGVARSPSSSEAFREDLAKSLPQFAGRPINQKVLKHVLGCVAYVQGEPDDKSTYTKIGQELARIERERSTRGNRLFYLATP